MRVPSEEATALSHMADAAAAAAAFTAEGLAADSLFSKARRAELAKRADLINRAQQSSNTDLAENAELARSAEQARHAERARHAELAKRAQQGSEAVPRGEYTVTGLQGETSSTRFDMHRWVITDKCKQRAGCACVSYHPHPQQGFCYLLVVGWEGLQRNVEQSLSTSGSGRWSCLGGQPVMPHAQSQHVDASQSETISQWNNQSLFAQVGRSGRRQ